MKIVAQNSKRARSLSMSPRTKILNQTGNPVIVKSCHPPPGFKSPLKNSPTLKPKEVKPAPKKVKLSRQLPDQDIEMLSSQTIPPMKQEGFAGIATRSARKVLNR